MVPGIVIAGQSNALGVNFVESVPNYVGLGLANEFPGVQYVYQIGDQPEDPLVWIAEELSAINLQPMPGGNFGKLGVELSLGRRLARAGYEHAIAKYAIGSTSLGVHWKANGTFPTGDNLFTRFIAFCSAAETSLAATIAELIWIQGEADAGNEANSLAYAANFALFASTFRTTFPGVPITINRLHSAAGGSFNSTIRAQQDVIKATVPGVRLVSVDDLPLVGAHFTSESCRVLGERFADRILRRRPRTGLRAGLGAA